MSALKNILVIILWFYSVNSFAAQETTSIKIGVTAGPHADIMEFVSVRAKHQGLDVKVIEFNDFILPNIALSEGDLDMNIYQHGLYLDAQIKDRGYKFVSLGKNILLPMGMYSNKITNIDNLENSAKIAIPNDPSNAGRALLLLEQAGLISLKSGITNPSILDITENNRNLQILELEAPQIPRALDDVDLGVINMDWILLAGINPASAIVAEGTDSPYANLFVVHIKNQDTQVIKRLIEIYQSGETRQFIADKFGGSIIGAW
jgi:D-methionine transport system substrate-binding protein